MEETKTYTLKEEDIIVLRDVEVIDQPSEVKKTSEKAKILSQDYGED